MNTKPWVFALLLVSSVCVAQVPVVLEAPTQDEVGQRFFASLQSEIRLSNKFYLWTGRPIDMPPEGIHIVLISVETKLKSGQVLGSAVVAIASHNSQKDRGADRIINIRPWFISKEDQLLGDATREYLSILVDK